MQVHAFQVLSQQGRASGVTEKCSRRGRERLAAVFAVNFYVYRDLVLRTWKQRLLHALKRMFTALCLQKSSATELTKI